MARLTNYDIKKHTAYIFLKNCTLLTWDIMINLKTIKKLHVLLLHELSAAMFQS